MPVGTPKLVLLSALDVLPQLKAPGTEPALAVPGESEVKADVEPADLCIEIGPFSAEPARDGFTDWVGNSLRPSIFASKPSAKDSFIGSTWNLSRMWKRNSAWPTCAAET